MCPADHGASARDQVVRHERDADVVVRAALERVELPPEVATPREGDDPRRPVGARIVDQLDRSTGLDVDVDDKEMG